MGRFPAAASTTPFAAPKNLQLYVPRVYVTAFYVLVPTCQRHYLLMDDFRRVFARILCLAHSCVFYQTRTLRVSCSLVTQPVIHSIVLFPHRYRSERIHRRYRTGVRAFARSIRQLKTIRTPLESYFVVTRCTYFQT